MELEVIVPEELIYSGKIRSVSLPTQEGEIEILEDHIPLLGIIKPGLLHYVDEVGKPESMAIDTGFYQVIDNRVSILSEAAIDVKEIDHGVVQEATERAQRALAKAKEQKEIDVEELEKLEAVVRFNLVKQLVIKQK